MGRIRHQAMAQPLSECGPSSPAGLPVEPVCEADMVPSGKQFETVGCASRTMQLLRFIATL